MFSFFFLVFLFDFFRFRELSVTLLGNCVEKNVSVNFRHASDDAGKGEGEGKGWRVLVKRDRRLPSNARVFPFETRMWTGLKVYRRQ